MSANRLLAAALAAALLPAAAAGQSLADRVARAPDGAVRLSFQARPGICGDGQNIISRTRHGDEWERDCQEGPVRVAMDVSGRRVTSLRTYVGGRWRGASGEVTDLGTVAAPEAAAFLLGLARTGSGSAAKHAVFAATLADSATVWPELLRIARDDDRPREVRKAATFWVGQEAASAATAGLEGLARDETVEDDVRESAIFALSQRPRDEGVPALIDLVRRSGDPRVRKKALFWLGQSGDPRALALFQEILTRR